jgi:hypothetical protein
MKCIYGDLWMKRGTLFVLGTVLNFAPKTAKAQLEKNLRQRHFPFKFIRKAHLSASQSAKGNGGSCFEEIYEEICL